MASKSALETVATPEEAVDRLTDLFAASMAGLRASLRDYSETGTLAADRQHRRFCYPELRLTHLSDHRPRITGRAFARFQTPGVYATTVTQPAFFRSYLLENLRPLMADYRPRIEVGLSEQEIPYPYALERGGSDGNEVSSADLARQFTPPQLWLVGDDIVDSNKTPRPGDRLPLSLFDALRVDFSLHRLTHYTGSHWSTVQPWILLTNYQRYVSRFVDWALEQLASDPAVEKLVLPGDVVIERGHKPEEVTELVAQSRWDRFQMPAYHLVRSDGQGTTLVNIGVGPSNAKNITDHLAILRPHCWLMIGHCGGLRQSQTIGDYVLAHAYLRRDQILDEIVPTDIPIPALAEVQLALQQAVSDVTGDRGEAVKRRLRTGTIVTYDDRNWELRWSQERRRINLSRAIAVDMESGTIAAQGYRFRVPYGTLLCVSDKPLHGEIKLPGPATAFYQRAVQEHLMIGLRALDILRQEGPTLHSRKLRSFDEPPFR